MGSPIFDIMPWNVRMSECRGDTERERGGELEPRLRMHEIISERLIIFKHGRKGGAIRVEQQRKEGDEPEGCLPCLYEASLHSHTKTKQTA